VQHVLAETGASQVNLIGHSQGGMLAEYCAKILGGARYVHDLVGLSPTTHGTTLDGLTLLAGLFPGASSLIGGTCPACTDQETGSAVIGQLDDGPLAQAGVSYTIIETLNETVVTPLGSSFIHEPGVTNEYVQRYCPFDTVDHGDLSYDPVVFQVVLNALDPATARYPTVSTNIPPPRDRQPPSRLSGKSHSRSAGFVAPTPAFCAPSRSAAVSARPCRRQMSTSAGCFFMSSRLLSRT
jgi:hypothetical protein